MATAVSSRGGLWRNWTGSLSDLESCGQIFDYFKESPLYSSDAFLSWRSEPSVLIRNSAECDFFGYPLTMSDRLASHSNSTCSSPHTLNSMKIRHFLCALQNRGRRKAHITADRLKPLPVKSTAPMHDGLSNEKIGDDCLNLSLCKYQPFPYDTSESRLFGALFDLDIEQLFQCQQRFSLLARPKRRNCNSESDLAWSLPDPVQALSQEEVSSTSLICDAESSNSEVNHPNMVALAVISENILHPEKCSQNKNAQNTETVEKVLSTDSTNNSLAESCYSTVEDSASILTSSPRILIEPIYSPSETTPLTKEKITKTMVENSQPIFDTVNSIKVDVQTDTSVSDLSSSRLRKVSSSTTDSGLATSSSSTKLCKSVSFADQVGQPLTEVFIIEHYDSPDCEYGFDDPLWTHVRKPRLQASTYPGRFTRSRLKQQPSMFPDNFEVTKPTTPKRPTNETTHALWVLRFPQPAAQYYEFRQRIENGSVSLENISVIQPDETSTTQLPQLSGTIKVRNLAFEKQVWIRLTTDNWHSYTDHVALYSHKMSGGLIHSASRFDTFTFHLTVVPQLESTQQSESIEFAIRYMVGPCGAYGQFWDNNSGKNYVIERKHIHNPWPAKLTGNNHDDFTTVTQHPGCYSDNGFGEFVSNTPLPLQPYTPDYRPNFEGITQFTNYRAWNHFAGETTYY
ncbi:putative phosphatase regulatory subunit [Paragonimus heterotremus]|uniref:Putative phosphatase regulatory subunit n=1 Tax=Paragonimus heterotremus TaxID=100268 RepID=A0A8J4WJ15_9TREM|nr:putative phosphatase regulatory subunit [Paragonimus heterotremus]